MEKTTKTAESTLMNGVKSGRLYISSVIDKWRTVDYSWYQLRKQYGIKTNFKIDFSTGPLYKYSARGLYCQQPPYEQNLLVKCSSGCARIIIVDLRPESPSFKRHNYITIEQNEEYTQFVFIPSGCAFGYVTLKNDTVLHFKADNYIYDESCIKLNLLDPYYHFKVPFPDKTGLEEQLADLYYRKELLLAQSDVITPWVEAMGEDFSEEDNDELITEEDNLDQVISEEQNTETGI